MRSGRNSGDWLVRMISNYPKQCALVVGVLSVLSMFLRDHPAGDVIPPALFRCTFSTINQRQG